jgi:hypothetical protein
LATRDVFSEEESARLRAFPEISRAELIRFFTLTESDETFVRQFRGTANVFGAAVQLCTLAWLGFVPYDVRTAPAVAVNRLAERMYVPPGELSGCAAREQTRTDHLREIQRYCGWRTIDTAGWKELDEFLFARALEHDSPKLLFAQVCAHLSSGPGGAPGRGASA